MAPNPTQHPVYVVKSIIGPSLGVFKVNNWAKFVFLNRLCKKPIQIGVSAHFLKIKSAQIFNVNNWAKLGFFLDPQLGPIIDFNLAQLLTLKMVFFYSIFLLFKKC